MLKPKIIDYKKEYIKRHGIHAWIRNYGTLVNFKSSTSLEQIVKSLEALRRKIMRYCYTIYNGVYLYSLDVNMDSAFRDVYNMSRKAWLYRLKKEKEMLEKLITSEKYKLVKEKRI